MMSCECNLYAQKVFDKESHNNVKKKISKDMALGVVITLHTVVELQTGYVSFYYGTKEMLNPS